MKTEAKYVKGDVVIFKLVRDSKATYNGVILGSWGVNISSKRVYTVASMNHGMRSYSLSEEYIVKKIS